MTNALSHKPGLIYFWALNDELRDEEVDRKIRAFADADVSAVCLHPRPGLLLPYGGDAWFEFIRRTVDRCAEHNLDVWLYDEDPYPSGACGGLITMDRPEYAARAIKAFEADASLKPGDNFTFPAGRLMWCGLVHEETGETRDLTARVGVIRQTWELLDPWDSKWYYPNTPLYSCPRSDARGPELAVRVPEIPAAFKLRAFVALPSGTDSPWGALPDTLNSDVTAEFIRRTHDRYRDTVGDHFGKTIRAIFTDEPKYFGGTPWTPGLFEEFEQRFGYDLRPRLWDLFSRSHDPRAMMTRLHYRQYLGERFVAAWLEPVARWCRAHDLPLVGHISPEDDPVEQAGSISNLMPIFPHFAIPGIDLIIPAVGDSDHPLINIGVLSATSAAQQGGQAGVLSETLGCSGLDATAELAGRIFNWQSLMGVTTPVVHAAFQSTADLRVYDAPPDWGPDSSRWPGMAKVAADLAPVQAVTWEATQIAPVAVLWPIRSFHALPHEGYSHDAPLRDVFASVVDRCLSQQVGLHLLDEAVLHEMAAADGWATQGKARYSHVVVPECLVLHDRSVEALQRLSEAGVTILRVGEGPQWLQGDHQLKRDAGDWCQTQSPDAVVATLPRLVEVDAPAADVRCTVWEKGGRRTALLMTLGQAARPVTVAGQQVTLEPDRVHIVDLGPAEGDTLAPSSSVRSA